MFLYNKTGIINLIPLYDLHALQFTITTGEPLHLTDSTFFYQCITYGALNILVFQT